MVIAVVVMVKERIRLMTKFRDPDEVEQFIDHLPLYSRLAEVNLIDCTHSTSPNGSERPDRIHMWCPYCGDWRIYYYDEGIEAKRCRVCGVTERNYYFARYNQRFLISPKRELSEKARERKARRAERKKRRMRR